MRKYGVARSLSWVLVVLGSIIVAVALLTGVLSLFSDATFIGVKLGQSLGLGLAGVVLMLLGFSFHALFDMTEKYLGRGG
jgi:hypothetical protein